MAAGAKSLANLQLSELRMRGIVARPTNSQTGVMAMNDPRPVLLNHLNFRWGSRNFYPLRLDPIKEMCDYGAGAFRSGECDLVNFDCMPGEDKIIESYMADKHPDVRYTFGSPRRTLARAIEAWEKRQAASPSTT
jgi:hypothetical protein